MTRIAAVHARQLLDSRGNPTVEVDVFTEKGVFLLMRCRDDGTSFDAFS